MLNAHILKEKGKNWWRIIFGMDSIRRVTVNLKKLSSERDQKMFEWWMAFSTTREDMAYEDMAYARS